MRDSSTHDTAEGNRSASLQPGSISSSIRSGLLPLVQIVFAFALLCSPLTTAAQDVGSVSGVVVNSWDGTPLAGAVVTVRGTTLAAQTGADGRYQLNGVPPGDQVLRFSKSGYAAMTATEVRVLPGQATTVNGNLRPEFYEMEEYEVAAEEFTQQTEQILLEREKASTMMEAIGSEQLSRLGVGDAAEALGKVTGVSIADGKYAVIRGLGDRYTSSTLNGVDIPSADPDRKAAQLDLLPAKVIQQIDVSKTFSPDMAGGFAGGAINVITRNHPDKFEFNLELGGSYNTQASLQDDFLLTDHGKSDWRGKDDGTRALPGAAAATSPAGSQELDPAIKSSFKSRQFAPVEGDSPLNSGFFASLGNAHAVGNEGTFGYLGSLTYKNNYTHYEDGRVTTYEPFFFSPNGVNAKSDKEDIKSVIEYTWSGMVSLGYTVNEYHNFGFNFLYVQTAEDEARRLQGQDSVLSTVPGVSYVDQSILHWTERNLTYYQLYGSHEIPDLNRVKLDWVGALSSTTQSEPDHRIFQFYADPTVPFYGADGPTQPSRPTRIFRNVEEDNQSLRLDLTVPVPSYNDKENNFKTGMAYSHSERAYDSRVFDVRMQPGHPFSTVGDPNIYLAPENEGFISYYNFPANWVYNGSVTIPAAYAMGDWFALEWLRLVGGVRFEDTDIEMDVVNLTKNDEQYLTSLTQQDWLPSLAATIYLQENLLLRGAWSETVVRPTYREIAKAEIYDVALGQTISGNPELLMSASENYDLRLEWYPHPGSLIAVSAFYKKISGPIELRADTVNNDFVVYYNSDEAELRGVEGEIRENLGNLWKPLKPFTLGFNAAFIESEVPLTSTERSTRNQYWGDTATARPMYDQPDYVINGDFTWEIERTGTTFTLAGGVVGQRLILVGLGTPDRIEEPAPMLDVIVTQKLGKHWKMKFSAKNLLDPTYEVSEYWPKGVQVNRSYTKGMTFGLSLSCEF